LAFLVLEFGVCLIANPEPTLLAVKDYPPKDGKSGQLTVSGPIPKGFKPDTTTKAQVAVTLNPDQRDTISSGPANFEISQQTLTVHVTSHRSLVDVNFTLLILVPGEDGTILEFSTSDTLNASLDLRPLNPSVKTVGGMKYLELTLQAARNARVRVVVRSSSGDQEYEQISDVGTTPRKIILTGPVFERGKIFLYEEGAHTVDERQPEADAEDHIPGDSYIGWVLIAGGVVLLGLAGGIWWVWHKNKQEREEIAAGWKKDTKAITKIDEPPRPSESGLNIAQEALQKAKAAVENVARLQEQDTKNSQELQELGIVLASRVGQKPMRPAASPPLLASPPPDGDETRLLAVANEWLASGNGDREKMAGLLSRMQLGARWYGHKDLAKIFADLGNYTYDFEPSERNGGWLWLAIEGSSDVLAVPADVTFFQLGKAPEFLERLFEGMENAKEGFRFARFYRACRLRPAAGGGYSLAAKGLLQLEGEPAPASPRRSYESLLSPSFRATPVPAQSRSQQPGNAIPLLRTAMELMWDDIQTLQNSVREVRSARATAAPPPSLPPVDEGALKALIKTEVERGGKAYEDVLKAAIKTEVEKGSKAYEDALKASIKRDYEDRLGWLEKKIDAVAFRVGPLVKPGVKPPPLPSPTVALPQAPVPAARIETGVRTDSPVAEKQEPSRENVTPAVEVKETLSVSVDSAAVDSLSNQPQSTSQPPAPVSADAPIVSPLPEDWQDLLDRAARDKESQLKPNQLSTDNYLSRLHRLRYYFDEYVRKRTKSPSIPGRVVHMLHQDGRFAVHETQTIGDPPVRSCKICGETVPFPQLVLCFGADGAETLHILLPYGAYVESNYLKLYQLALSNPPTEQLFDINAIQSPAVLRRGSQRSGPYEIVERMRWSR